MSLSITDVKQLLGQGLRTDSASAKNTDSEGAENARKQATNLDCDCQDWRKNIGLVDAPFILQAARSGFDSRVGYFGKRFAFCPWCSKPLMNRGSAACGPYAPVDEAVPKEKDYFSTHLKRTGDFIEPLDY